MKNGVIQVSNGGIKFWNQYFIIVFKFDERFETCRGLLDKSALFWCFFLLFFIYKSFRSLINFSVPSIKCMAS